METEPNELHEKFESLKMEIEEELQKEPGIIGINEDNNETNPNVELDPEDSEKSNWQTFTASNGLKYYFNSKTQSSQWDKPVCLMSTEEKEGYSDWKECQTSDGKTFYYNSKTKSRVWIIPNELKLMKERLKRQNMEENKNQKEITGGGLISFSIVITHKSDVFNSRES